MCVQFPFYITLGSLLSHCVSLTHTYERSNSVSVFLILTSLSMISSCCCKLHNVVLSESYVVFHCENNPQLLHWLICSWVFELFPYLDYCITCSNEHRCSYILLNEWFCILSLFLYYAYQYFPLHLNVYKINPQFFPGTLLVTGLDSLSPLQLLVPIVVEEDCNHGDMFDSFKYRF